MTKPFRLYIVEIKNGFVIATWGRDGSQEISQAESIPRLLGMVEEFIMAEELKDKPKRWVL